MYYYKRVDEDGNLLYVLTYENARPNITDHLVIEITDEEYKILSAEIEAANQQEGTDSDEISDEEALNIILGVSE